MPTNVLRAQSAKPPAEGRARPHGKAAGREIVITAGRIAVRAKLLDTMTAERIWVALPLYSTVETWGNCIRFETPVETGRERTARLNVAAGEICYGSEDDRVVIGFGPTPISHAGEIRLPRPCNLWAIALDDVRRLADVTPGEKVSMVRAAAARKAQPEASGNA